MSAVALCTISQEHCTGEVGGSRKGREIRKCWVTREGTTLTKKPPPFRLASLLHRKPQTFPAPTHQRKSHTLSGQTEPRNRKSRKHRKSGVARKGQHWRVLGYLARAGGIGRAALPARAGTGEAEVPFGRLLRRVLARAVVVGNAVSFSPGRDGQTEWRWGDR